MWRRAIVVLLLVSISGSSFAQWGRRSRRSFDIEFDRSGVPDWEVDAQFPHDVFTFVRLRYDDNGWGGKWATDFPDSDLNLSFRLQQLTALKVNPDPIILDLSDPKIFEYPFLYIIEPGYGLGLTDEEARTLRRYLDNGGFVMVDDFWGEDEWDGFYHDIRKVFPDREPVELPLEHPIFHCVYDLKEKPQVPSIHHAMSGHRFERWDAQEVHYRAYFDDQGGLQMIICHNTDLGDGWEREGMDPTYFREYSEKWAYPMGINILFYAMTH